MLINVGDGGGVADVEMAISKGFHGSFVEPPDEPSPAEPSPSGRWLIEWSCVVVAVVLAEARPQFARLAEWRYAVNVCLSAGQSRSGSISAAVVYVPFELQTISGYSVSCIHLLVKAMSASVLASPVCDSFVCLYFCLLATPRKNY